MVFKSSDGGRVAGAFCKGGSIKGGGRWVIWVSIRVRSRSLVWSC